MKPKERRQANVVVPRGDDGNGGGEAHEEDAWFNMAHKMTQKEQRSLLKSMSHEIDNDPDQESNSDLELG